MNLIRNNPAIALILVLSALVLLGASLWWTFLRAPASSSPFEGQQPTSTQTTPTPDQGQDSTAVF